MTSGKQGLALLLAVFLSSCAPAPARLDQYILTSSLPTASPVVPAAIDGDLRIGAPRLAAHLRQPGLCSLGKDGRLNISSTKLWAGPLDDLIAQTLSENLNRLLPGGRTLAMRIPEGAPSRYLIELQVDQFQAAGGDFVAAGVWILIDRSEPRSGKRHYFAYRLGLDKDNAFDYADMASQALGMLSMEIVRALAEHSPVNP